MAKTYELWEMATGNLIGAYASQEEALAFIGRAVMAHGEGYVDSILLGVEDENGRSKTIAMGEGLARLASVSLRGPSADG